MVNYRSSHVVQELSVGTIHHIVLYGERQTFSNYIIYISILRVKFTYAFLPLARSGQNALFHSFSILRSNDFNGGRKGKLATKKCNASTR